jgi:hypothetical protein
MANLDQDSRVRRYLLARRAALLIGIPLAVLGGARAVSLAANALKTWNTGETLTAADLNGNFVPENLAAALTAGGPSDLRWAIQHAAAAGACAALSTPGDSPAGHIVLIKPAGVTCTNACMASPGGAFQKCRSGVAIGMIRTTQATATTDIVASDYNYGCGDTQNFDETMGNGLTGTAPNLTYTEYCCCYQ